MLGQIKVSKPGLVWLLPAVLIGLTVSILIFTSKSDQIQPVKQVVDDWAFDQATLDDSYAGGSVYNTGIPAIDTTSVAESDNTIGLAVGGAKDIDNFRRNIDNNYLPSPADLSHEGIFYDYLFETGARETACTDLFCPSYATAVSADPFSDQTEHFLAVGLNSNIKADEFERKKLNLVVVLDISGSMAASLDSYYYDQPAYDPNDPLSSNPEQRQRPATKMDVANRSLVALLKQLRTDDRFGVVLFDDLAYLAKPMRLVGDTDIDAIAAHILEIEPQGGTNMEAGYREGTKLLDEYKQVSAEDYENRIIFLTDAMPNQGITDEFELAKLAADNADNGIYTSFIGIGLDFNAELISTITRTQGANYFSVHSSEEFERRLGEGFEYMVTPLVFDLTLKLVAEGYDLKAVYGSPEANLATGEIMKVNTLFPSLQVDGQTRGGLILLQLNKLAGQAQLDLSVSYRDRSGQTHQNQQTVVFPDGNGPQFDHLGIRKGIALSRLVNVLKDWLNHTGDPDLPVIDYAREGIPVWDEPINLSYWERTSRALGVTSNYREVIRQVRGYLASEIEVLDDDSLNQELEMLDLILASPNR